MASSDFCLKWNDHHNVFFSSAEQLCGSNLLCDVTLSAGGTFFQAHKLVLCICSEYFQKVFSQADKGINTIVYLKDVESEHLGLILSYMYRGEITVKEGDLMQLLATASDLKVRGLSEMHKDKRQEIIEKPKPNTEPSKPPPPLQAEIERKIKRKQEFTLREPLEKLTKLEPQTTTKVEPIAPKMDNESRNQDTQLISEEALTDLTAEDIEELDYDEDISDINGEYRETSQTYLPSTYENQTSNALTKSKKPSFGLLKAFPCGMCDMSFDQNWLLKRHYRTHTRERPFRCSLCSRHFSLRDSCIRHIRNVHRAEMDAGDISNSNVGSFCQYDEGAGSIVEDNNDVMYGNEALAITM